MNIGVDIFVTVKVGEMDRTREGGSKRTRKDRIECVQA